MRSQLTRSVFRALLSPGGLVLRCPSRAPARWKTGIGRRVSAGDIQQRRTLFGFSRKEERKPKQPELAPGLETFLEFSKMSRMGARPPPDHELSKAWKLFFEYKTQRKEAVNSIQAAHILQLFNYCKGRVREDGNHAIYHVISTKDISLARSSLVLVPKDNGDVHKELARAFYKELNERQDRTAWYDKDAKCLLEVLVQTGEAAEARTLVQEYTQKGLESGQNQTPTPSAIYLWNQVLGGFAKEDNEVELVQTAELIEKIGIPYNPARQSIITCYFASKDDIESTKRWYNKLEKLGDQVKPRPETLAAILKFSIRNNELDWCKECFRQVLQNDYLSKELWDVVLQWAAGAVGKGVEDVERMMEVMTRRNPDMRPDITTINGLVDLAISQKDPYLAERYIALGLKSGIYPNAQTFILQMNYRIHAGDLTGAQTAYEALQSEEILNFEDLPVINHYIRALCASRTKNYDRIIGILQDLDSRHAKLEADTVCAVAMLHMHRDEIQDVYDILQTNCYHYTLPERAHIRDAFVTFVLDRSISNSRAWDGYQVLRQIFDETDVELRTQLMEEFFDRGRSDMACYVFGHMRQHPLPSRRPVLNTYISVLLGIAKAADTGSLDMIHNMLKLDSSVEPNTKLYNALMLAYASTGDGDRALDFWDDITNSSEGPSYRSLEIVMRACQVTPFGDLKATEIWGMIKRMEIEVTKAVWDSYIGALAGGGKLEAAQAVVENGEGEFRLKPDFMT